MSEEWLFTRRGFLAAAGSAASAITEASTKPQAAHVAITLDLEMSRNFPTWDQTHWDYEKGNLNQETKNYTLEACRRVKAAGGVAHRFLVGRALEQDSVDWLKEILKEGHQVGNHTYDHVNVKATKPAEVQFRFRRSPWLLRGSTTREVIEDNIRVTSEAMKSRLGVAPAGFRTPGGFHNALTDRPDLQRLFQDLGYTWVSSKYPSHPMSEAGKEPSAGVLEGIVKAQAEAQPFAYAGGLVEVPMSPISDISAFRNGKWKLDWFLKAIRLAVERTIDECAAFDFLGHPSCLYVVDPEFRTIDLICELVRKAGGARLWWMSELLPGGRIDNA